MAVLKSNVVTNRNNRAVQTDRLVQGVEHVAQCIATSTGAMADNDVIVFCEIPVDARITSIRFWCTDHGTTGTLNVGFHAPTTPIDAYTDTNGVIDEDAIGTVIDINTAAVNDTEIRYETKAITTAGQTAWELSGLSSKPSYNTIVLTGTLAAATTAAGTFVLTVRYTK